MLNEEWVTGEITLSVNNAPLTLKLQVPANKVSAQIMLPLFQHLANSFTDFATKLVEKQGHIISCQKGCGACCRQPVPLSEIEVYHIASVVEKLPESRKAIVKQRFQQASETAMKEAVRAYLPEQIACPFLEEESCSIHLDRPIACREYLVTSPKENCATAIETSICIVPLPINASDGIRKFARTKNLNKKNFLPLARALDWAQHYPQHHIEKTGEEWLAEFFT